MKNINGCKPDIHSSIVEVLPNWFSKPFFGKNKIQNTLVIGFHPKQKWFYMANWERLIHLIPFSLLLYTVCVLACLPFIFWDPFDLYINQNIWNMHGLVWVQTIESQFSYAWKNSCVEDTTYSSRRHTGSPRLTAIHLATFWS